MSDAERIEQDLETDREHLRDTLGALEDRMSPGRLIDEAMAHFNTGPKAFLSGLTAQIGDKPLPALVTGIGLAWLMMSDGKRAPAADGASAPQRSATTAVPPDYSAWHDHDQLRHAEATCLREVDETPEAHARRLEQAQAAALGLAPEPQEDDHDFSRRIEGAARSVREKGAAVREALAHAARSAKGGAAHGVDGLQSAARNASDGARSALASGLRFHESNPIAAAALGVALGALLGSAVPLTRREESVFGGVADRGLAAGAGASRKAADAVTDRLDGSAGAGEPGPGNLDASTA